MKEHARALIAGFQFLTRLPVPSLSDHRPDDLARSTPYFPLIGAVVGLFGAAIYWLAALGWPPLVAVVLATAGTVWLTGAFHEDALADACDGFGGGWDREQVLTIMKDSRVGSYGVVGLVIVMALKVGALATLAPVDAMRALVVGHVVARWSSLPLIYALPYARETAGKSRPFAASVTPLRLAMGTLLTIALAVAAVGARSGVALAVAAAVTLLSGAYYHRRIGGITGDCLGATNQIAEAAVYLALSARIVG